MTTPATVSDEAAEVLPAEVTLAAIGLPAVDLECPPSAAESTGERLDRQVRALAAHLTRGGSLASAWLAWFDWQCHLAVAPGKFGAAWESWLEHGARSAHGWVPGVPAPARGGDLRFGHPDWKNWPWRCLRDTFLDFEGFMQSLTEGVPGVSPHHGRVASFMTRQWVDWLSPSNVWFLNPAVLHETVSDSGTNFIKGAGYWLDDLQDVVASIADKPWLRRPPAFAVGRDVAVTPGKVVYRNHLMEVIQYRPATPKVWQEPLLIVPSWIMKYYILDLQPQDSLVRYLVEHGHTVFMVSWRNPGEEARDIGLNDYLEHGVLQALAVARERCGGAAVHGVGYCLGGTLLAVAAALLARDANGEPLKSATLFAAQVDFSEPGELGLFIDHSSMAVLDALMWSQGYLDGWQLAAVFQMLGPRDRAASRVLNEYMLGKRLRPSDLVSWNRDATRLPYRMHADCLNHFYLSNDLARGRYCVGGKPVALADIDIPLFAVATEHDHVSPWQSVYKLHLLTRGELSFVLTSGGHNAGIVAEPGHPGRRFHIATRAGTERYRSPQDYLRSATPTEGSWWPCWQQWLETQSTGRCAARNPEPGALEDAPGRYVHEP